ncbi:phage holin family protein [Streptomyces sp. GD-15H]|uniref:phage holin family protein n=1 Tax=Streptomyces sp. GD-15H TaxID=3129112 RepID=UPI00324306E2
MSESVRTGTRDTGEEAKAEVSATAGQAKQAASQVAGTAAEQARTVAGEARQQAGTALHDLRSRVMDEAEGQTRRAAGTLRQWASDLADLADHARNDSAARGFAAQAADRSHRAADYLEEQGAEGLVSNLQGFARRRPGAFLGGALLAGLVVGRLGKAAGTASQAQSRPSEPGQEQAAAGSRGWDGLGAPPTQPPPPGPRRPWGRRRTARRVTHTRGCDMSSTSPTPHSAEPQGDDRSVGQLLSGVTSDLQTLFRQEVELAKAEIREEGTKAGKAAGMYGGAGFAGYLVLLFLSLAAVLGLANVMDGGWAALIVAAVWAVVAAVLYQKGRARMRTVSSKPEQTVETMKENAEWARHPTR